MNPDTLEAMFAYICKKQHETSSPPTLRELANTFYMSTGVVLRLLARMEEKGWILRDPGKARGIMLLRSCDAEPGDDETPRSNLE